MQWKRSMIVGLALLLAACGAPEDQNGGNDNGMENGGDNGNGGDMEENGDMNGDEATGDNANMTEDLSDDMAGDDTGMQGEMDDMNGENGPDEGEGDGETALDKGVREMELDIQFTDDTEWEFDYETEDEGSVDAEVDRDDEEETEGEEAREEIEGVLQEVQLHNQQADEEMAQEFLNALEIDEGDMYRMDLFIELETDEMYNIQQTF